MHPFPTHTKEAWIEQVKKELPTGISYQDLLIKNNLFEHDGLAFENDTNAKGVMNAEEWKITACITDGQNSTILQALENGADCIYLRINENTNIESLLENVRLDYITTILSFDQCSPEKIIACKQWINDAYTIQDLDLYTMGLKDECNTIGYNTSLLDNIDECTDLVKSIANTIHYEDEIIMIEYQIGNDVYQEISKIRAIKMVLDNVKAAYQRPNKILFLARPLPIDTSDFNQTLISLSLKGMSAIWANANFISLYPWHNEHLEYSRLAQNVQHLYKLESNLNAYPDPMAGSALIEQLTVQIADKIWKRLIEE